MRDPTTYLLDGYQQHKHGIGPGSCFKFSDIYDEYVVICDEAKIVECYAAPSDALSSFERNKESIQIKWIMGEEMHNNPYPIRVIRDKATAGLLDSLDGARNEICATLNECIGNPDSMSRFRLLGKKKKS